MKILHATTFVNGGAGNVLVDLAMLQMEAGHEIRIVANKTEFDEYRHYQEPIQRLQRAGIQLETFDSLFKRDTALNRNAAMDLRAHFSTFSPFDVVHAHASVPAKVCKKAFIQSQGRPLFIQTMHGWGLNKNQRMEEDDVNTMNTLNGVATLNESGKKLLISKGVSNSRLHVIPNGISTKLSTSTLLSSSLSRFLASQDWVLKFLCIGEIGVRKNLIFLMNAIRHLNEIGIRCCAVFIGPEQCEGYFQECVNKSATAKMTFWTGEIKNASSHLQHFDAMVLPSKSEGMPLSILEAFRAKKLVFGSRISEIEELIGKRRGILFGIESTREFVKSVVNFDTNDAQKITENAYNFFHKQLSLDSMFKAYLKLYQR